MVSKPAWFYFQRIENIVALRLVRFTLKYLLDRQFYSRDVLVEQFAMEDAVHHLTGDANRGGLARRAFRNEVRSGTAFECMY